MKKQAWTFFRRLFPVREAPLPATSEPGEAVIGKGFTPELFAKDLSDLGFDMEIFTDPSGKIIRIRRIPPKVERQDGDGEVW